MIAPHATDPCSKKPRTPRPCPPPVPSLLGAVVGRIRQTHRGAVSLQTSGEEGLTERHLGTLAFRDRLAVAGVGMPAMALRQSTNASAPSLRLRPLPDHVTRAARGTSGGPGPSFPHGIGAFAVDGGGRAVSNRRRRYRETDLVSGGANGSWDELGGTRG